MTSRVALKSVVAAGLQMSGLHVAIAAARRRLAGGRRVIVVGYHRVVSDFERERRLGLESTLISKDTFRAHLDILAARFRLVTMSEAADVLTRRTESNRDVAAITFDDGYADILDHALPVLRERGAPATVYVSTGVVDGASYFPHDRLFALLSAMQGREGNVDEMPSRLRDAFIDSAGEGDGPHARLRLLIRDQSPVTLDALIDTLSPIVGGGVAPPVSARALDRDGLRALAAAGLEVGAHTVSHSVLPHLSPADVDHELAGSIASIQGAIGRRPVHFAYCNGYWNARIVAALRRRGFVSAVTTEDRLNRLGDDPMRIGRRVLWENSARGVDGRTHQALLACQLDDTWRALGLSSAEPGELSPIVMTDEPLRRPA
jgi:peptidoglycan/xylan/chitin deacetylase (PgdA/CDA1 family)